MPKKMIEVDFALGDVVDIMKPDGSGVSETGEVVSFEMKNCGSKRYAVCCDISSGVAGSMPACNLQLHVPDEASKCEAL